MSHGHTRIESKGSCIYCGERDAPLTDEHVVPFALGGQHVLVGASCRACANITTKFERDVARDMWGDARISYNASSRRKKERATHVTLTDPDNPARRVKVPYKEYPAAMIFYKMGRCGLLEGLPEGVNVSSIWQLVAAHDDVKAKAFEGKFGVKLTSKFRHMPDSFARLIAKIGYCNIFCNLDLGDFRPICLPYILGQKSNPSYIVGGTFEIGDPEQLGYRLSTYGFGLVDRLMLVAEVRLYCHLHTPTYHAVIGDVIGQATIAHVLQKLGNVELLPCGNSPVPVDHHCAPRIWPLPFWRDTMPTLKAG
ncbi:MAG TPA: HNH endonuclease [Pseudolabrys sp.]|nr:HNH endonuclease [Pseudolabrys sp.]